MRAEGPTAKGARQGRIRDLRRAMGGHGAEHPRKGDFSPSTLGVMLQLATYPPIRTAPVRSPSPSESTVTMHRLAAALAATCLVVVVPGAAANAESRPGASSPITVTESALEGVHGTSPDA